ncbi:MAG: hypothetical protein IPM82_30025 [Saprospiraceae bacterium]|nr:hypothetical protein [Saprospiraceae bacterium]
MIKDKELCNKINHFALITTCEEKAARFICTHSEISGNKLIKIGINGFSQSEAYEFMRNSIKAKFVSNETLQQISLTFCALPILCQLVKDIVVKETEAEIENDFEIILPNELLNLK